MAAISIISPSAHVTNPEHTYTYMTGLVAADEGPPPRYIYGRIRLKNQRKTYIWTAKGPRGDRDLCGVQMSLAGWVLDGRGFTPSPGSDTSADADGNIYGTYYEHWTKVDGREYEDPDNPGVWI